MKRLNKKAILTSSILALIVILCIPKLALANGFIDKICEMIAGVICFLGDGIVWLCDALGGQFDKLIFNYDGDSFNNDFNLLILKGNTISKQILSIYSVIQFLSALVLITVGLWIVVDFTRTADDPRHKAILLDRLKKLVLAIFLINSIPVIIDVMLAINYALTDTFRTISQEFVTSSVDYGKSFLTETFKGLVDEATGSNTIVLAIVYLIAGFINLWLIIFYMIRDLGISFLVILAPFMVCLLPYRMDLLVSWLKEMASNIFTQSIQALIFTIVLAIVAGLSEASDLYSQIFALVAFAMFIPLTATIKKMIGLEGNVGAANSRAGLGAAVMTIALAGKTISGIQNQAGMLHSSNERIKDLKTERDNFEKRESFGSPLPNHNSNLNYRSTDYSSNIAAMGGFEDINSDVGMGMAMASMYGGNKKNQSFNNVDTRNIPRDKNVIQGEINARRKERNKALFSNAVSMLGSGVMAIGASGLGPMGAFAGANVGANIGKMAGDGVGTIANSAASYLSEKGQDAMFGEGIRPDLVSLTQGNKNWDLDNAWGNVVNMNKNRKENWEKIKSDMKFSPLNFANRDEKQQRDFELQKQARQDEMTGLSGEPFRDTEYYENEKDSIMQTQKYIRQGDFAKASRYRLRTSAPTCNLEGVKNLEKDSLNNEALNNKGMLYTDQNSSILFTQDSETGEREILATFEGNPSLSNPTMEEIFFNETEDIVIDDEQRDSYREQAVNVAIQKYGFDSIADKNNEHYNDAKSLIQNEINNQINQHVSRVQNLRKNTGSQTMVINGTVDYQNISTSSNLASQPIGDINIDIPENIESPYSQNIYSNIEVSKVNLLNKQMELLQQQQYTQGLQEGIDSMNNQQLNSSDYDLIL